MHVCFREELKLFCRETLLKDNTESEELVKLFSKLLTFLIPDVSERLETVVMIISDIQHPLEENENSKVFFLENIKINTFFIE